MTTAKASVSNVENSVLTRSIMIACGILTCIFILLLFFTDNLAKVFGSYADEATIGLMLLALWLVVSSTLRTVNHLAKGIQVWKLLLGGLLVGGISAILTTAFLLLFPGVAKSQNMAEVTGATGGIILMLTLLAAIISMIVVVNIRVRSRMLGNLLELLIIGTTLAGLIWWATK